MEAKTTKKGFVLEGGGAKGAYQMGVCKAYLESGYVFHGAVGTSIGAINAAMLASNKLDKALELWENISYEDLFEQEFVDVLKRENFATGNITTALKKLVTERGINKTKMKEFLSTYIDEDVVRSSGIEFGLVTLSLSERKPYEIFLEDIPEGKLIDYILASAKLPIFQPHTVDENRFVDGGFINNCPINMLLDAGYDEVIAIRTKGFGLFRRYDKNANVVIIESRDSLGHFLDFSADTTRKNIKKGYCDGLRVLQGLKGESYYLKDVDISEVTAKLFAISEDDLANISDFDLEIFERKRVLFERLIPEIAEYLRLSKDFTYDQLVISMFEFVALRKEIDRFEVYNFAEFRKLIKDTPTPKSTNLLAKVGVDFYARKANFVEKLVKLLI